MGVDTIFADDLFTTTQVVTAVAVLTAGFAHDLLIKASAFA